VIGDKGMMGGSTPMMLLSLLEEKERYGYEMIRELEERSEQAFRFKEGTLYPVLHRMESAGLVEAYLKTGETGKSRRYYRITKKGRAVLADEKKQWEKFCGSVERVIGGAVHAHG